MTSSMQSIINVTAYRQLNRAYCDLRSVLLIVLACLLCIGNANAQYINKGDVAPFDVVYEIGNHLINAGTARLSLTNEGELWTYSLVTKPRGIIKLAGKGRINEVSTIELKETEEGKLQIQPQTYQYRQDDERRREVDATFDWSNGSVVHVYRGKVTTETFETPLIDRLSSTLLMMNALRNGFETVDIQVFDTGRIKSVTFTNDGNETLDTPLGKIETIRVSNKNSTGGSRETTTWFAPSLDYVPVKIEHRKRGELVARLNLLKLNNRVTDIELEPSAD